MRERTERRANGIEEDEGTEGSSWRLRLGLSRTARRGCARVIGVGGGARRVGGQGKAWNWWRQSVARRAPQRPSDLAVEFFHLFVSCSRPPRTVLLHLYPCRLPFFSFSIFFVRSPATVDQRPACGPRDSSTGRNSRSCRISVICDLVPPAVD